ncbi:methyltransferase domain-containing protein [Bradyrhizobium sp. HKCCYLS1011]|uniref:methyltransferase domain-containing protein n=1 Tax=Bradyrhizobium sp. HKCCYLS1011 TaxID=3420733 RepID=UPI003EBCD389
MNRNHRRALAKRKDPLSLVCVADAHMRAGRMKRAEEMNREAIALDPQCYEAHNNLGHVLRHTGRTAEAVGHFSLAFQINPNVAVVAYNLAMALSELNRFSEALPFHRRAAALDPSSADAHSTLAFSLGQLAEHAEAEQQYLRALQIDPLHFGARINLGLALVEQGRIAEAYQHAQVLAQADTAPGFPHKTFGILLARVGCQDGARLCFERHLAAHPQDRDEIAMLLAAVGGALPARATDQQIVHLYNSRADGWDKGAAVDNSYRGHQLVAAVVTECNPHSLGTVIDAGCGTGLVGELLRPRAQRLIGIDMSDAMLAQAREKNCYDDLHCGDLLNYMARHPSSCDVIASAATLVHFGELNAVFAAARQCLRPGGVFVFTVFPNDDDEDAVAIGTLNGLAQGGCFRHGAAYVARTAAASGLSVEVLRREVHEYARKVAIPGIVVALRSGS